MNSENLQSMLKIMERELHDLKTVQGVMSTVKAYSYECTPSAVTALTITYESGSQAIVSEIFTEEGSAILGTVDEETNTQKIFFMSQVSAKIQVVSTRPILSIA